MSLFRKPKKIQRRVFCADDDEDEDGEPVPPPPPFISLRRDKKENNSVKAPKLLSFVDEEEDCEEFKVKKSSQSKRLSKRREKERKKIPDDDNYRFDQDIEFPEDNNVNHTNNKDDEEKAKPKKKVTLEGLILSGREALAADGTGDLSGSGEEEEPEEEEDSRGFHKYRAESVRAALAVAPGHIPDAALIHAARKTRQQARELGELGPGLGLGGGAGGAGGAERAAPGPRLLREGDDDSAEEEGRVLVRGLDLPSDKPTRGTAAAPSDEEADSEPDHWEDQQMQKAVPVLIDITGALREGAGVGRALLPAPAPAPAPASAPASAAALVLAWRDRLAEMREQRRAAEGARARLAARLAAAGEARAARARRRAALAAAYTRAQAARGYLTDLAECLDEKMPALQALEARALERARRRCDFLVERRRADLRDQAQDVLGAPRGPEPEDKVRRAAEREGRRRARRLRREAAAAAAAGAAGHTAHTAGDSSDDDLPPALHHHYTHEGEAIRAEAARVFSDAWPAWRSARGVARRLAAWRRRAPAAYCDAHVSAALPKLLAPYVRHQLILWNPLADEDNEDYEKMDWYKTLMMYGVGQKRVEGDSCDSSEESESGSDSEREKESAAGGERAVREDVDLMLLPTILNKVVLPKVTELVEAAWDPMCVRACVRLRACVLRAAAVPQCAAPLRRLGAAARARLDAALAADVFLPALPPQLLEGGGGAFWRRCAGSGVRLVRGALALAGPPPPLAADGVVMRLIERLCVAAGCAPGPLCAAAAAALAAAVPRGAGPLRRAALRRLAALAVRARDTLQHDNPLHLKALEQTRAVIAEAKAAE